MTNSSSQPLLTINNLSKHFPIERGLLRQLVGTVKAVDGVSLEIETGETLGLVGESGCGKTTLGRCILRGIEPTSGKVYFRSGDATVDLLNLPKRQMRSMRREMQMIFQDPYSSLDPRMTVYDIVAEPLMVNSDMQRDELEVRVRELVELVGLEIKHIKRYPHAFSGGQRQRVGIARSLALNPRFIVCDEAVSALDVSIQAQILNLLQDLQTELNLTYLFIAHDLSVVQHISDRVVVMYVGRTVEIAETDELYGNPKHPYTEALLSAVPKVDVTTKRKKIVLSGEVPNPANPPSGCYFHPRCRYARDVCSREYPPLEEAAPGHWVACHFAKELTLSGVNEITGDAK